MSVGSSPHQMVTHAHATLSTASINSLTSLPFDVRRKLVGDVASLDLVTMTLVALKPSDSRCLEYVDELGSLIGSIEQVLARVKAPEVVPAPVIRLLKLSYTIHRGIRGFQAHRLAVAASVPSTTHMDPSVSVPSRHSPGSKSSASGFA